MPATSISIRRIRNFEMQNNYAEVNENDTNAATIRRRENTLIIGRYVFRQYNATLTKGFDDSIQVFDENAQQFIDYDSYQKQINFQLFFCNELQLLFSTASTPNTKKFLKIIEKSTEIELDFSAIHFDFEEICRRCYQARSVRFNTIEPGVNSKSFSGPEVDANEEAIQALQENTATQLTVNIDILNRSRTVMITQSGTMVCFSSLIDLDDREEPMLEFAIEFLQAIGEI